jgi:hypothetical protein
MLQDAADAWRFSASSTLGLTRRFVLVEHLEQAYGLTREQLVAAAQKEPLVCHLGRWFKTAVGHDGPRGYHITHIAYNPDEGCVPHGPQEATDVFGPAIGVAKKRRSVAPPDRDGPVAAARQQATPKSARRAAPEAKRASRPSTPKHGASSGGLQALAAARDGRHDGARVTYAAQLAALEAQVDARVDARVEARLAAEGAKMKLDAEAIAAKATDLALIECRRTNAFELRSVAQSLEEERALNAEFKTPCERP